MRRAPARSRSSPSRRPRTQPVNRAHRLARQLDGRVDKALHGRSPGPARRRGRHRRVAPARPGMREGRSPTPAPGRTARSRARKAFDKKNQKALTDARTRLIELEGVSDGNVMAAGPEVQALRKQHPDLDREPRAEVQWMLDALEGVEDVPVGSGVRQGDDGAWTGAGEEAGAANARRRRSAEADQAFGLPTMVPPHEGTRRPFRRRHRGLARELAKSRLQGVGDEGATRRGSQAVVRQVDVADRHLIKPLRKRRAARPLVASFRNHVVALDARHEEIDQSTHGGNHPAPRREHGEHHGDRRRPSGQDRHQVAAAQLLAAQVVGKHADAGALLHRELEGHEVVGGVHGAVVQLERRSPRPEQAPAGAIVRRRHAHRRQVAQRLHVGGRTEALQQLRGWPTSKPGSRRGCAPPGCRCRRGWRGPAAPRRRLLDESTTRWPCRSMRTCGWRGEEARSTADGVCARVTGQVRARFRAFVCTWATALVGGSACSRMATQ